MIENTNTRSGDYAKTADLLRPGHADYTAYAKYHGFQDARGGGHFSGRVTAALVAGGAIVLSALRRAGIDITTISQSALALRTPALRWTMPHSWLHRWKPLPASPRALRCWMKP